MSYAMEEANMQQAYNKLGSFDKLLNLLESGQLQQILAEIKP